MRKNNVLQAVFAPIYHFPGTHTKTKSQCKFFKTALKKRKKKRMKSLKRNQPHITTKFGKH